MTKDPNSLHNQSVPCDKCGVDTDTYLHASSCETWAAWRARRIHPHGNYNELAWRLYDVLCAFDGVHPIRVERDAAGRTVNAWVSEPGHGENCGVFSGHVRKDAALVTPKQQAVLDAAVAFEAAVVAYDIAADSDTPDWSSRMGVVHQAYNEARSELRAATQALAVP